MRVTFSRALATAAVVVFVAVALPIRGATQEATRARANYTVRTEHRFDGEPYQLHRWSIPLADAVIEVFDLEMGTRLAPFVHRGAAVAINGGFYGTDHRAEGLVIARGREISSYLPRIGGGIVVVAQHRAQLLDGEVTPELPDNVDFAIQCRPRLVVSGQNNIARRTAQTAARTALCLRDQGRQLDIYVARRDPSRGRAGPTLHTLADVLVREGCDDALNLDGGPSTGAAWRSRSSVRALRIRRGVRHALVFRLHGSGIETPPQPQ